LKIKLSLDDRNIQKSNIVLIEEAENHLSFPKLNQLIKYISDSHNNKQIVISTHSSFVANKL
jgi:putative ATP-dependent endonuclease of OLD family